MFEVSPTCPEHYSSSGKPCRSSRGALFFQDFSLRVSVSPCENFLACRDMGKGMALNPQLAQHELNRFCAGQRVVAIERQFVEADVNSFWSLCCYPCFSPFLAKR